MTKKVLTGLLARELGLLDSALVAFEKSENTRACDQAAHLAIQVEGRKHQARAFATLEAMLKEERSQAEAIAVSCELGRARLASNQPEVAAKFLRSVFGKANELAKLSGDSSLTIYPSYCQALAYMALKKYTLALALANSVVAAIDLLPLGEQEERKWLLVGALLCSGRAAASENLWRSAARSFSRLSDFLPDLCSRWGLSYPGSACQIGVLKTTTIALLELADWPRAAVFAEEWVASVEAKDGSEAPSLIEPLCYLASAYEHWQRSKGVKCLDRALDIVASAVADEPFTGNARAGSAEALKMPEKEYQLLMRMADSYLLQGKLADSLKLYPATMRARYTNYVSSAVNLTESLFQGIGKVRKYYADRKAAEDIE